MYLLKELSKKQKYYLLGILSGLLFFLIANSANFQKLNTLFWDKSQQIYSAPVREDIIIASIDDHSLQEIGAWPWDRSIFADSIQKIENAGARTIATDVTFLEARNGDDELQSIIDNSHIPIVLASKISDNELLNSIITSPYQGFTNILQDNDGIVRQMLLNYQLKDQTINSFSQAIYQAYLEKHPKQNELQAWNTSLPSQVNFSYGSGEFQEISIIDIINQNYDPQVLKDKIVLIGSTAKDLRTGLVDNVSKVGGIRISGVELHAYILSALLNKNLLFPISKNFNFIFSLLIIISLLATFRKFTGLITDISISILLSLALLVISSFSFDQGILIPTISYLTLIITTTIYSLISRYLEAKESKEFLKKAFTQYMNPQLLNTLLKEPELLKLGGTKKEMTILFSDIRSFTTLSEALSADELVSLLNAYLDKMSKVIFQHEGVIDKFIGDAIMAFWNSPISDPEHPIRGILTAISMTEALEEFNQEYDGPNLAMGIGVHTGEVTVGNMGSTKRFDFTVIGDNVNLSARLEGLTKKYGVGIIISEATLSRVSEIPGYITRKLDTMIVKGKNLPISIHQPLKDTQENQKIIENYEKGFKLYQSGSMDQASQILEKNKEDKTSQILIERIQNHLTPCPKDWDGIWKWTEK